MKKWLVGLMAVGLCVASAWAETVTYTVKSKTEVEVTSGTAPDGSTAEYVATANNTSQITANNTATLTLKGFEGTTITGLTLSMKSNASKGKGSLSVKCGETEIASIADANFNDKSWYGAWSTEYVDVNPAVTETAINGNVVILISGSVNSLYCQSYTIEYESGGEPPPFSIQLKPAEDFTVYQGAVATITATPSHAAGEVTYVWGPEGVPGTAEGNVFTLDTSSLGTWEVTCDANDGIADAEQRKVSFTVEEAPEIAPVYFQFETGASPAYSATDTTFDNTGLTAMETANIAFTVQRINRGKDANDKKVGDYALRLAPIGETNAFAYNSTAFEQAISKVSFQYAMYGSDSCDSFKVLVSADGSNWNELVDLTANATADLQTYTSETVPENSTFIRFEATNTTKSNNRRMDIDEIQLWFGEPSTEFTFSLVASATEVAQGDPLTITATPKNAQGEVAYVWQVGMGVEGEANGPVYTVDTASMEPGEGYQVSCKAQDMVADPITKTVTFNVKAPTAKYTVTVADGVLNGTVELKVDGAIVASPAELAEGTKVTVVATPASGFKLDKILLDGAELTENPFTVMGDALVTASFVEKPAAEGDELTRETTGVTGNSYKDWTATGESGTKYAGNSAGGNDSIQLNTGSPKGIVITESAGKNVASVTVEWNANTADKRSIEIYGSTTAYAGPADLYGDAKGTSLGEIAKGETTLAVPEGYPYIGILAKGGALYLSSVTISFGGEAKPSISGTVASEIMLGETASATFALAGATATEWTASLGSISDGAWTWTPSDAGTFTLAVTATYDGGSAEASYDIVVKDASLFDRFTKVEGIESLEGGEYLVIGANDDAYFAMAAGLAKGLAAGTAVEVKTDEEVPYVLTDNESLVWTVTYDASAGMTIYSGKDKYLGYDSSKADNMLYSFEEVSDASTWTVAATESDASLFTLTSKVQDKDGIDRCLRFNYNNGNTRFAGYKATSTSMKDVAFFKKGAAGPSIGYTGDTTVKLPGSFSLQFSVRNYEGAVTWAVTSREGGSISSTGLYTWSPMEAYPAPEGIEISVAATGEGLDLSKTVKLVVEPKDEPGPGEAILTCTEGTTINATVNEEVVLHFTLTNAEFYTGDGAEELIGNTSALGVVSDVTATSFAWTYTPTEVGTVTLDFFALEEGYESEIIKSYLVTLNVTEGGGGGDAVTVKSFTVKDDGSVEVTLSDGTTTSSGLQYSTDLKTWSITPVDVKKAASAFVRVGAPE